MYSLPIADGAQGQSNLVPVLEPSLSGRLLLNYQQLELESKDITLRWLYYPDPNIPCVGVTYTVELYRYADIMNAETESDIEPFDYFHSLEENIILPSDLLTNDQNALRISTLNSDGDLYCARMEHLAILSFNG